MVCDFFFLSFRSMTFHSTKLCSCSIRESSKRLIIPCWMVTELNLHFWQNSKISLSFQSGLSSSTASNCFLWCPLSLNSDGTFLIERTTDLVLISVLGSADFSFERDVFFLGLVLPWSILFCWRLFEGAPAVSAGVSVIGRM